jgi:hypothetical protein
MRILSSRGRRAHRQADATIAPGVLGLCQPLPFVQSRDPHRYLRPTASVRLPYLGSPALASSRAAPDATRDYQSLARFAFNQRMSAVEQLADRSNPGGLADRRHWLHRAPPLAQELCDRRWGCVLARHPQRKSPIDCAEAPGRLSISIDGPWAAGLHHDVLFAEASP